MPRRRTFGIHIFLYGGSVDSQFPLDCPKRHPLAPGFLNRLPSLLLKERRFARRGGCGPAAVPEAVAVAVHLQDVDVVGEPVQQRSGQPLRVEHVGPFVEGQVGGHQDGSPIAALAEDLEEQFRSGGRPRHVAQFVDDQQAEGGRYRCRLSSGISSLASSGPLHIVFTGATPQPRFPSQGGCPGLTVRI